MKPPQEFKVVCVRECVAPLHPLDTPQQGADYWHANIPSAPWFDPCKEALVVLVLNTRRRILGHNLVALGTLDSVNVHAREVFKPAIAISAHAIVLIHNHPSAAIGIHTRTTSCFIIHQHPSPCVSRSITIDAHHKPSSCIKKED